MKMPRPCLSCGAKAEHQGPREYWPEHWFACSSRCGRFPSWGWNAAAALAAWNLSNEPISEAQARARAEARLRSPRP